MVKILNKLSQTFRKIVGLPMRGARGVYRGTKRVVRGATGVAKGAYTGTKRVVRGAVGLAKKPVVFAEKLAMHPIRTTKGLARNATSRVKKTARRVRKLVKY